MYGIPYPRSIQAFSDLEGLLEQYVFTAKLADQPFIEAHDTVVTMGSCFAVNVGKSLAEHGVKVVVNRLHEEANTPLSNVLLLDYLMRGESSACPHVFRPHIDSTKAANFLAPLRSAKCLIFTVGVGICPFDRRTGDYVLRPTARGLAELSWQYPAPEEHARHLMQLVKMVRSINPAIHVVFTLSPVPLYRAITESSPFAEDAVSKSHLRVALHILQRKNAPSVHYWPSFEAVRWVGSHIGPVFGTEDSNPRHVDSNLVRAITTIFVRHAVIPSDSSTAAPTSKDPVALVDLIVDR